MRIVVIILLCYSLSAQGQQQVLGIIKTGSTINPYAGKNMYYYGNSITYGYPLSDLTKRWSTVLSGMLSATEVNHGISSSTLEKRTPLNPICCGTNMLDRLVEIPTKTSGDGLAVFMFGMNDWGYNGVNYNPTNFIADYQTVINNALSKGWAASDILIISPTYPTDAAFPFYDERNSTNSAPTRAAMLDFQSACQTVATNNGCMFYNMYNAMAAQSNLSSMILSDGVHPNVTGHQFIAQSIYNFLFQ
jgi:lysophospholipase L1-like esterase